jgi:hypothetical protein
MKLKFFLTLNEISFKKKVPVKVAYSSEKEFETRFNAAEKEWIVTFRDPMYADDWEVAFYSTDLDPKNPWDRTGEIGDQIMQVFFGIAESIRIFIKKIDPEYFFFRADPSRVTLYKNFAKIIERESKYEMIHMRKSGNTYFHFAK